MNSFPVNQSSDNIKLGLNQSIYDNEDLKQIINHKLKQSIVFNEFDDPKLDNMENELIYNYVLGASF
ncbi:MAG: hypothetical protein ACNI3H_02450 [Halarcobacter ebronensis]